MELPKHLRIFMEYEKNTNRLCYSSKIVPYDNFQDPFYSPEKGNIFEIKSYWLKKTDVCFFSTETFLLEHFNRENKVLFLIHPESEDFYSELDKTDQGPTFKAIATSSSRTVLLILENVPLCFAKLSLNKKIGGSIRTIPQGEIARSIGTTIILDNLKIEKLLPENFNYFREVISVIPKNLDRGGMILREIPEQLLKEDTKFELMPMFSLFTKQQDEEIPIYRLSEGQDLEKYIYTKIIIPYVDQYFYLGIIGISTEPHSQNLLIEINSGDFFYRDFGGFNINLKKITQYSNLPYINDIKTEYFQDEHWNSLIQSIFNYFLGGVIYGVSMETKISYKRLDYLLRYYLQQKMLNYKIRSSSKTLEENLIFFFKNNAIQNERSQKITFIRTY